MPIKGLSLLLASFVVALMGCGSNNGSVSGDEQKQPSSLIDSQRISSSSVSSIEVIDTFDGSLNWPSLSLETLPVSDLESRLELAMTTVLSKTALNSEIPWPSEHIMAFGAPQPSGDMFSAFDGRYWFVGSSEESIVSEREEPTLHVWSFNSVTTEVQRVASIALDGSEALAHVESLYLVNSHHQASITEQIVVRRALSSTSNSDVRVKNNRISPSSTEIVYQWLDVDSTHSRALSVAQTGSLNIDGEWLGSQRRGDILYVVSRYQAWQDGLTLSNLDDNLDLLESTPLTNYLPKYTQNGQVKQLLSESCMGVKSSSVDSVEVSINIINVTAIDIYSKDVVGNICVNGDVDGVHITQDSLYLLRSDDGQLDSEELEGATQIHKFSLKDKAVQYQASGFVPGVIAQLSTALQTTDNRLYVVTTQRGEDWRSLHNVYSIAETDLNELVFRGLSVSSTDSLQLLAGDEIGSVQFTEDRVYVFSAEDNGLIDVVSLNDHQPMYLGRIPSYFNGLSANARWVDLPFNYILSIANQLLGGVSVAMIDVSNIEEPMIVGEITLGELGSYSDAVLDAHSLSVLPSSDGSVDILLPAVIYKEAEADHYVWDYTGQFLFNAAFDDQSSSLSLSASTVLAESSVSQVFDPVASPLRAIVDGRAIFSLYGDQIFGLSVNEQ